jgi:hypothetical protein
MTNLPTLLLEFILSVLVGGGAALAFMCVLDALCEWASKRRERRVTTLEAELDKTQAELRAAALNLAEQLNGNAHEARKALIRESFLARGEIPKE